LPLARLALAIGALHRTTEFLMMGCARGRAEIQISIPAPDTSSPAMRRVVFGAPLLNAASVKWPAATC